MSNQIISLPHASTSPYKSTQSASEGPIIIDNGSHFCKAGWAMSGTPEMIFRPYIVRNRFPNVRDEILVGNEISHSDFLKYNVRHPFEGAIVSNFSYQEMVLDHIFDTLGLSSGENVPHPLVVTEVIGNPPIPRQQMSELLFEGYAVPAVCYGIDQLFSAFSVTNDLSVDYLSLNLGASFCHVLPFLRGKAQFSNCKRTCVGGRTLIDNLQRSLLVDRPRLSSIVNSHRVERLLEDYCYLALDYDREIRTWNEEEYYSQHVIGLRTEVPIFDDFESPFEPMNNEDKLKELLGIQEMVDNNNLENAFKKMKVFGICSSTELHNTIKSLKGLVYGPRRRNSAKSRLIMIENETEEMFLERISEDVTNAAKRRPAKPKAEETLPAEANPVGLAKCPLLRKNPLLTGEFYDSNVVRLGSQRVRIPELIFQPDIGGIRQCGLIECIETVLAAFSPEDQSRLASNIIVSGGVARLPNLRERLEQELRSIRPFKSELNVTLCPDPLVSSWVGGAQFSQGSLFDSACIKASDYWEFGSDVVVDHCFSNCRLGY